MRELLLWNSTIADDRGEKRALDVAGWKRAPAWGDPGKRFVVEEARRLAGAEGGRLAPEIQGMWAVAMVFGFVGLVVVMTAWSKGVTFWVVVAVFGGYMLLAMKLILPRAALIHRDKIVDAMCGAGLCAACAYDLSRTDPTPDGAMVVCPECGGAWRAERIRERLPVRVGAEASDVHRMVEWATRRYRMRRIPIKDDDGREVFLQARYPAEALRAVGAGADRERCVRAHTLVRNLGSTRRLLLGGGAIGVALLMMVGYLLMFSPVPSFSGTARQLVHLLVPLPLVLLGIGVLRGNVGMDGARARQILLRSGLCPTCSDDLRGRAAGADGLVRCGTCGGAWRLPEEAAEVEREPDAMAGLPRLDVVDEVPRG